MEFTNTTGTTLVFTPVIGGSPVSIANGQTGEVEEDSIVTLDPGVGGGPGEEG